MTRTRAVVIGFAVAVALLVATGLSHGHHGPTASYTPQTRHFTVVTVSTLTNELAAAVPAYKPVVKKYGEVYSFQPGVLVVYQGDTVALTIRNLQPDDPHTFTLGKPYDAVSVTVAANTKETLSFKATEVGAFEFYCTIPGHLPYMSGELLVLPDSMGGGSQDR